MIKCDHTLTLPVIIAAPLGSRACPHELSSYLYITGSVPNAVALNIYCC